MHPRNATVGHIRYSRPADFIQQLDQFTVLSKKPDTTEWKHYLRTVLSNMGFEWFLVSLGDAAERNDPFSRIITTYPKAWIDCYKSRHFFPVDPIVKHCRKNFVPLFWETERQQAQGSSVEFWVERERFGLRGGVTIPLRHNAIVGSLNVAYVAESHTALEGQWTDSLGSLFMLVPFLMEGIGLTPTFVSATQNESLTLTEREIECLRWSGIGKSSWEIGVILGCTERTVNFHIGNATKKLGACNRRQAVGVALAQGIIAL